MQLSLTVNRVRRIGGRVYVRWSDKTEQDFGSLEEAREKVASKLDRETLRALALSRYLFIDPNGTNPGLIEGRTITFTNENNAMVAVS